MLRPAGHRERRDEGCLDCLVTYCMTWQLHCAPPCASAAAPRPWRCRPRAGCAGTSPPAAWCVSHRPSQPLGTSPCAGRAAGCTQVRSTPASLSATLAGRPKQRAPRADAKHFSAAVARPSTSAAAATVQKDLFTSIEDVLTGQGTTEVVFEPPARLCGLWRPRRWPLRLRGCLPRIALTVAPCVRPAHPRMQVQEAFGGQPGGNRHPCVPSRQGAGHAQRGHLQPSRPPGPAPVQGGRVLLRGREEHARGRVPGLRGTCALAGQGGAGCWETPRS
jgi:hypothetical protein